MISVDDCSDEEENACSDEKSGEDSCCEENEEDELDEPIQDHNDWYGCRSCDWSKLFLLDWLGDGYGSKFDTRMNKDKYITNTI